MSWSWVVMSFNVIFNPHSVSSWDEETGEIRINTGGDAGQICVVVDEIIILMIAVIYSFVVDEVYRNRWIDLVTYCIVFAISKIGITRSFYVYNIVQVGQLY